MDEDICQIQDKSNEAASVYDLEDYDEEKNKGYIEFVVRPMDLDAGFEFIRAHLLPMVVKVPVLTKMADLGVYILSLLKQSPLLKDLTKEDFILSALRQREKEAFVDLHDQGLITDLVNREIWRREVL